MIICQLTDPFTQAPEDAARLIFAEKIKCDFKVAWQNTNICLYFRSTGGARRLSHDTAVLGQNAKHYNRFKDHNHYQTVQQDSGTSLWMASFSYGPVIWTLGFWRLSRQGAENECSC